MMTNSQNSQQQADESRHDHKTMGLDELNDSQKILDLLVNLTTVVNDVSAKVNELSGMIDKKFGELSAIIVQNRCTCNDHSITNNK